MADALTFYDQDETTETRVFIRMIDQFFDCLNVRSKLEGKLRRKDQRVPYTSPSDYRFKVRKLFNNLALSMNGIIIITVAQRHIHTVP